MVLLGYQNGYPLAGAGQSNAPPHLEPGRDRRELPGERLHVQLQPVQLKLQPHEEGARVAIRVFIRVHDVGMVGINELSDSSNDALAIGASDQKHGGVGYGQWTVCMTSRTLRGVETRCQNRPEILRPVYDDSHA